ncbi:MAG: hypothetical protein ACRDNK_10035 [Solirubrobacteraceae bacterium]
MRADIAIAVVIAAIVLIVSPGTAIDAILVLILLVVWGVIALVDRRRSGRPPLVRFRRR